MIIVDTEKSKVDVSFAQGIWLLTQSHVGRSDQIILSSEEAVKLAHVILDYYQNSSALR